MKQKVRINAELPPDVAQQLADLATKSKVSLSEVIRRSIRTESYLQDKIEQGGKVLIEQDGKLREIVFR